MVTLEVIFLQYFPLCGPHLSTGRWRRAKSGLLADSERGLPAESNDLLYCKVEGCRTGLLQATESAEGSFEVESVASVGKSSPVGVHGTDGS